MASSRASVSRAAAVSPQREGARPVMPLDDRDTEVARHAPSGQSPRTPIRSTASRSASRHSLTAFHRAARTLINMKGPVRDALRQLTRATRPLALRSAGKPGSSTAVVIHVGRRSGRSYRTPVVAVRRDDSFVIALPYGERTDWAKNVLAQGSASLVIDGHPYDVGRPEVIPMAEAANAFRAKEQRLQRRFGVHSALRVQLS